MRLSLYETLKDSSNYNQILLTFLTDLDQLIQTSQNVHQSQLALLAMYKDYFASLVLNKKLKKSEVQDLAPHLLRVLSKNDEFLLMILFSKYVFPKDLVLQKSIFLGYC